MNSLLAECGTVKIPECHVLSKIPVFFARKMHHIPTINAKVWFSHSLRPFHFYQSVSYVKHIY